jgi:hypothetical protein
MWILNLTALLLKIIHTKTTSKESFWTTYGIPKDKYPCDGEKAWKNSELIENTPFINQSEDSIHI